MVPPLAIDLEAAPARWSRPPGVVLHLLRRHVLLDLSVLEVPGHLPDRVPRNAPPPNPASPKFLHGFAVDLGEPYSDPKRWVGPSSLFCLGVIGPSTP